MEEPPKEGVRLWGKGGDANAQELELEVYVDMYILCIYMCKDFQHFPVVCKSLQIGKECIGEAAGAADNTQTIPI